MKAELLSGAARLPVLPLARSLAVPSVVPAMTAAQIDHVRHAEAILALRPQVTIPIQHVFHGGNYARTATLPAGIRITGCLVKIPTTIIISGDAWVWLGDEAKRIKGHAVLAASAGRKQMFQALKETAITMIFPTSATTVEEAEREFTDEWETLASRKDDADNRVIATGE